MRTGTLSLLLFCLLIALHSTATAQALTDKDAGKLIDEYVAVATSDSRRNDLEKKLLTAKPSLTTKNIKSAFGVDKKRATALALATKLWTPGVFSAIKRYTDSDLCAQIVRFGLQRQEKDAMDYLLDRWKLAALESAEFLAIHEGFKTTFIDLPYIDKIKAIMEKSEDEARKIAAAEVLSFQLDLNAASPQDILDAWDAARSPREKDGKRFPMEGRDLLASLKTLGSSGYKRCGANFVLQAAGDRTPSVVSKNPEEMPPELAFGAWKITIRVFLRGPLCEGDVGLTSMVNGKESSVGFSLDGKNWTFRLEGGSPPKLAAKFDTWITLTINIKAKTQGDDTRAAQMLVDGQKLGSDLNVADGPLLSVNSRCSKGEIIISGFEYIAE